MDSLQHSGSCKHADCDRDTAGAPSPELMLTRAWGSGCPGLPAWHAARDFRTSSSSQNVPSPPVEQGRSLPLCTSQGMAAQHFSQRLPGLQILHEDDARRGELPCRYEMHGCHGRVCIAKRQSPHRTLRGGSSAEHEGLSLAGGLPRSPGTSSSAAAIHSHRCRDSICDSAHSLES